MNITYNLRHHFEKKPNGEKVLTKKPCTIFLVATIGRGQQNRFNTNMKVIPATQWDLEKQCIKPQAPDSVNRNMKLASLKNEVYAMYSELMNEKTPPTWPEVVKKVEFLISTGTRPQAAPAKSEFFEAYEDFIQSQQNKVAYRTIQKYRTLEHSLQKFSDETGHEVTFKNIDLAFYDDYHAWLTTRGNIRKGAAHKPTGLLNDTTAKYLENLKAFLKWSHKRSYHNNTSYQDTEFKATRKPKLEIITLTEIEVEKLQTQDLSNTPHLERVRDLFIFLIYTGQRWSDVAAYNKKQVKGQFWQFVSKKTGKRTTVPLIGFAFPAYQVLQKYDFELPKVSPVHFNRTVKEVGQKCSIDEPVTITREQGKRKVIINKPKFEFLTSHTGRRTTVTILLDKGVPPTTIMQLTGHSDLRTLMKYENTAPDALTQAFEALGQPAKTQPQIKIG